MTIYGCQFEIFIQGHTVAGREVFGDLEYFSLFAVFDDTSCGAAVQPSTAKFGKRSDVGVEWE